MFKDIPNIDVIMEQMPMTEQVEVVSLDQHDDIYYTDTCTGSAEEFID
jgi:hypothetical protein